MKLRFTPRAVQDIAGIADYIKAYNPAAATRIRDSILDALRSLTLFPRLGRPQSIIGVRKLVTRRHGFSVYYLLDDARQEIAILSIFHPSRDQKPDDISD
ncbi:MAG: type II toxin-antitoxin system RelE/ParE family toxin [Alphaproteobacteria bacterium]|nr:type II toxin-antitoxin system RelE/ParE family toxin [Alphaproteobacteria bacterium]